MTLRRKYMLLIGFTAPALIFYVTFAVYPIVGTAFISLQTQDKFGARTLVGLDNYKRLFTDPYLSHEFWNALVNSVEYFLVHLIVQVPVALLLAALLTSESVRRLTGFYRTIFFIPTTLSVVIVGFIWRMIINPLWGLVDFPLLGHELTALPTLSLMTAWEWVGIPMIFLYTALLAIPREVMEASKVDGATGFGAFWRIKLPLIAPQFGLISILTFLWSFNAFDIIYSLKGGAPGPNLSTDVFGTLFFRTFFGWSSQTGNPSMGATIAMAIFIIMLIITAAYFWLIQRRLKPAEM